MRVAVLAWGSLVWNRGDLAIATALEPNGPHLQVEFSRVSSDGRLTLVIDEAFGAMCATYVAPSAFDGLDCALENLWMREGSQGERLPTDIRAQGRVGFVDRIAGRESAKAKERHPRAVETIDAWTAANGYDAAVWTALASNFHNPDRAGEPFSIEAAMRYLEARNAATLHEALIYIRRAPAEVRTPMRAAVIARWPEA